MLFLPVALRITGAIDWRNTCVRSGPEKKHYINNIAKIHILIANIENLKKNIDKRSFILLKREELQ